ncbi:hypothetical protein GALMADRAFT_243782 [Galerina marginata CBS 339.88]|uniref:DUF6699 domain-containing protein n=1 Tax=Galerina marginata (strain CBS 339.88) TaxID=685588 RepID=A0A067T925_GALM3|nr:hypothetical protein GALMADRAFT_243782 [Galerina marginata CBS 339.88]
MQMQRSTSMRRSNSHEPPSRRSSLHRSASWGNSAGGAFPGWYGGGFGGASGPSTPAYAQGDLFDEHNLARRPRDWRPDFSVRPGIAAYIPRLGGNRSTVREYNDPIRRAIHPLLTYDPANPPIYYDTRTEPFDEADVEFLNLRRPPNPIDFAQLALQPTCAFMRVYHPRFPWYIDIHQSQPNGVTVGDVLSQINAQLHAPIHGRHFWNEELGEPERTAITLAFQERVREDKARLIPRGILQVDYFGKRVVFEGLARGAKGMWEMKTRKVDH